MHVKLLQNLEASLLISLFFSIMIPKSSKTLFESVFDGGITVCCHGVRFSFSEWNHKFKKETFTLLLCKHDLVLLHPQKAEQQESQYSDKINAPSLCPFTQMQCCSNT